MIHIDPASPDFEALPRQDQARIYADIGWSHKALAEEFGVSQTTIRSWLDDEFAAMQRHRNRAWWKTKGNALRRAERRIERGADPYIPTRVEQLEAENAELREQLAYLTSALVPQLKVPLEWGLTQSEERFLLCVFGREFATREAVVTALSWDKPEPIDGRGMDVRLCTLRKKVKPHGIEIKTLWGRGFYMPAESKAVLSSMAGAPGFAGRAGGPADQRPEGALPCRRSSLTRRVAP